MSKINRYYAQHTELDNYFWKSSHLTGWQVFDRDLTDKQGQILPIAFCISKTSAYAIRDALNQVMVDA
jgi:hypothetical protein